MEGAPFFHLWNEILRRMGVQKDIRPPEGSYLDWQAKEFNFTWPCPEVQYSSETINRMAENLQGARKSRQLSEVRSSTTWKIVSLLNSLRRKVGI